MDPKSWGQIVKERWNYFAATGVVLASIVGAFLLPPPASMTEHTQWFEFGRFLIALISGLWFVPVVLLSSRRTTWIWWLVSILLLSGGSAMFFRYSALRANWTVPYPIFTTNMVVIGDSLKHQAQRYVDSLEQTDRRELTNAELLWRAAGNVEAIWHMEDIRRREQKLVLFYLGSLTLLASAIITIIQASYCVSQKKPSGDALASITETGRSDSLEQASEFVRG